MKTYHISEALHSLVDNGELAGYGVIIRKDSEIILDETYGYADLNQRKPIDNDTLFRMASMTKCVTAVGIMKLVEEGRLELDAPLSKYLPEFAGMGVVNDDRYVFHEGMGMKEIMPKLLTFNMDKVKRIPADREITLRDLLSHSSGLQQGVAGMMAMMKHSKKDNLQQRIAAYSHYALDFQPGTGTGYSPCAAFDILGYLIGKITDMNVEAAYKKLIFEPLGMNSATFKPTNEQLKNVANTYTMEKGKLADITGTDKDLEGIMRTEKGADYVAGSAGLYCTVKDYEKFAYMLENNGGDFLKEYTVELMHTEAPRIHLEPEPGYVWGLGFKIRQDPEKGDSPCTNGTYGWSGALGTHFFISPKDNLDVVFATHRADLGGSASYVSNELEKLVFCALHQK